MWRIILTSLGLAIFHFAAASVWALDPTQPPSGNFDLSHWYLQLPVDSNGTNVGASASITTAQLIAGYQSAYFYTATNDGAMTFWAPDNGATTSGSAHPRSELREELVPGNTGVNWTPYGTHVLAATCVVSNVPADTLKVCLGQVHEQSGANIPMVMIMFYNNALYANIWSDGNDNNSNSSYQFGSSGIGVPITYQIAVTNGVLSLTINGITKTVNLFLNGANWQTNAVYFKAGAYSQTDDACNCSTDGAKAAFYSLRRYHGPSITNQPMSVSALAGTNVTFGVGAIDWTRMTYQWWLNATNLLAGATNSSLTVSNVSDTNAGNYTVSVSDGFGSVTSAVATLTVNAGSSSMPARANYQSTITNQLPSYYFKFDGNLVDANGGVATFSSSGSAGFGDDFFGDSNGAVAYPATSDFLSLVSPTVISGAGSATGVGSLSLLFYVPNTIPATGYYFSDSETTGSAINGQAANSAFALQFSGGALTLKIGNKSYSVPAGVTVSGNTWYFLALTYDLNGTAVGVNGINYYLGAVGGMISSAFLQKGGSGNLSSTATLGDGLAFVVGNKQAAVVGTSSTAGVAGGAIDELATWTTALSSNQIVSQFSALTVSTVPPPTLSIQAAGTNVIISWPSSTDPGFVLKVTPNVSSPIWSGAGSPAILGNRFVVTNGILPNAQFYRLKK